MIRRLYVHNYRCFENFDLKLADRSSWLLIGRNGTGKSTVGSALELLQIIGRGRSRVEEFISPKDLARGRREAPVHFEIEVEIGSARIAYRLLLELPKGLSRLQVADESLLANGKEVFRRTPDEVSLARAGAAVRWGIDRHSIALPVIEERTSEALTSFKQWLGQILILRPVPRLIGGSSAGETLVPETSLSDLAAWYTGLTSASQAAGAAIVNYLRGPMPDLRDIQNPSVAANSRELALVFAYGDDVARIPFADLSDGEKTQFAGALLLAAVKATEDVPAFCYWDEPDSHLSLDEVQHFIVALRQAFRAGAQIVVTSHHEETIRAFTDESTILLSRAHRCTPVVPRLLADFEHGPDLVGAMLRGDLEP